ncbi:MAG: CHASE2 domain-containing protein, partial [Proteobacteria bacterium]|nr:CHASE2 domain-containing protein [Pseudomonadota bacterium]
IDNDSIEKLGRWPWPRSRVAEGVTKISSAEPKIIGLNLILSEPEQNTGLKEIRDLENLFSLTLKKDTGKDGILFMDAMETATKRLDNDKQLKEAIQRSGKIMLPAFFKDSAIVGDDLAAEDHPLSSQSIQNVSIPPGMDCPRAGEIILPIPELLGAAAGIGHINFGADMDGTVRKERLIYDYQGLFIPSYPLRLAAAFLNVPVNRLKAELGVSVTLGNREIPLTRFSELLLSFKGKRGAFKRYSFFDVINDKVPDAIFKNKIVLVSPSASGIMNPLITSADISMPMGEFSANTIWAILNENYIREPSWGSFAELMLIIILGMMITFVFPRIKAMASSLTFFSLLFGLILGASYLFVSKGIWIRVTYPALLLVAGYTGLISIRFFITEAGKEKVEGESAETNRMLGVSFQEQGMLDMAFDKFRRVPMDDQMMGVLYNLAQDYERKRQLNKAASVYEYMAEYNGKYKDILERKKKLTLASETMVFGDGFLGKGSTGDGLEMTGTGTRPTLGRYEIIKQLGKGAMGVVYLGQDPRINRTTAIKTVRFSDDFEPEEAKKMTETFFREAESAGTLSHPNIVTIYDAGTEKDMAYIAMEYLEGTDLDQFTKPDQLLPMRKVIDYVADIADGLDYAHQKGIVHRDIKPANIMLLDSGIIKITDFGIARISASSQTMTGVIKGTPHYMSPEQFSGKKVDGRSDIFSLGTMMFRLLTGHLPFHGDNPAALMHNILNEPHPDPRTLNPKIIKPLVFILNKALEKDREKRYQRAGIMVDHLREVGRKIDAVMLKKQPVK